MRYVTVPEPVVILDFEKKRMREPDPDVENNIELGPDGKPRYKTLRDVPPISIFRYLWQYVFSATMPGENGKPSTPKIGQGYDGNRRQKRLTRLFEEAAPGQVVEVEEEDWTRVKKIIEEKVWDPPTIGAHFFSIEEAWMEAPDKKPALKALTEAAPVPA